MRHHGHVAMRLRIGRLSCLSLRTAAIICLTPPACAIFPFLCALLEAPKLVLAFTLFRVTRRSPRMWGRLLVDYYSTRKD